MKNSNALSLVLIVGIFVVIGCSCPRLQEELRRGSSDSTPSSTPTLTNSTPVPKNNSKSSLTLDKYNQIKNGMSYKQVIEIIGSEGVETMSSGEGKYKVTSYKWEGDDFKFITAVFMGDKLTSKVQANLK